MTQIRKTRFESQCDQHSSVSSVVSFACVWTSLGSSPRLRLRLRLRLQARLQLPCQHESQHSKVADERIERMSKGSRLVAFDQEVPSPGEAVSDNRPQQRVPRMADSDGHNDRD